MNLSARSVLNISFLAGGFLLGLALPLSNGGYLFLALAIVFTAIFVIGIKNIVQNSTNLEVSCSVLFGVAIAVACHLWADVQATTYIPHVARLIADLGFL